jgi:hypothetical protein
MSRALASSFALVALAAGAAHAQPFALETTTFANISPTTSTLDPTDPDGASGGRVNGLAAVANNNQVFYAASEWGGLFKSTDGGLTWAHLPGHVPTATWDVEVDPSNASRVYATSLYDGKVASLAGISVSTNAGSTWSKPASATPPVGFCAAAARRDEPSAFGIAIDPANNARVFVGTNCGLAISSDSGTTWTFVDPTPATGASDVSDVVVHHGGTIDTCGADGHRRSTDGGATWTTATSSPLPTGRCSIAASPDEAHVLFAVVGTSIFETDNGGTSWPVTYANPSAQGRIPFVETNNRTGTAYDLWFGDVSLHRGSCTTPSPPNPGGTRRCQLSSSWAGGFTRSAGAHDDSGAIVFNASVADNRCPRLFASDGGVFRNTTTASPACHTPTWEQPNVTPTALWHFAFDGVRVGTGDTEHLYHGNQDNGSFGTLNAGATSVTWNNQECCDGFAAAGESPRALTTICCFSPAPATRLFRSSPGLAGAKTSITGPPGTLRSFQQLANIVNFGDGDYVVATSDGVFITTNVTASPIAWTELGATTTPANVCGLSVARAGTAISFFAKAGGCNGDTAAQLFRFNGTAPGGTWTAVPNAANIGVYGVDPSNPDRILASHLETAGPAMRLTVNGGTTWTAQAALDGLMTDGGAFLYRNTRGPTSFTGFNGYAQPTLAAIDGENGQIMVAAAADSGVFLTRNGGTTWVRKTNPHTPTATNPHIPRARYAHFDHDNGLTIYLGTQGRGTWRMRIKSNLLDICDLHPAICGGLQLEFERIILDCRVVGCMVIDRIDRNCTVKWECPGCGPGQLCGDWWYMMFEKLHPDWEVMVVDRDGEPVEIRTARNRRGLVVAFQPKAGREDAKPGDYALVFKRNKAGTGKEKIKTYVSVEMKAPKSDKDMLKRFR